MSATLSSDLEELKRTVLHSAAILRLEEGASDGHLSQYVAEVPKSDKYLLLYSLIKLGLISGKAIFFVNDIDRYARLATSLLYCAPLLHAAALFTQLLSSSAVLGKILYSLCCAQCGASCEFARALSGAVQQGVALAPSSSLFAGCTNCSN